MRKALAWLFRLTVALAAILPATRTAFAADFVIQSQNMLHLGQGPAATTANKCAAITAIMGQVDLLLLQEVMANNVPCALPANTFAVTSPRQGPTTYKEAYSFVYNNKFTIINYTSDPVGYDRPPWAEFLSFVGNGKHYCIWVADIHVVFGKTVPPRQAEAQKAGAFVQQLRTYTPPGVTIAQCPNLTNPAQWPVIIGGDWNLPITTATGALNAGFTWVAGNIDAWPRSTKTSLTLTGNLSSAYDHFIYYSGAIPNSIDLSNTGLYPAGAPPFTIFRNTVSDHLGIRSEVTVTP